MQKTAVQFMMQFEMVSWVGPGNDVLDGGGHRRRVTNTIERPCGLATWPLCQITLITCYYYHLENN